MLPTQHFAASKSGVFIINSWVLGSYVAVVLMPLTFVPWDISVNAKQPPIWKYEKYNTHQIQF